MYTQYPKNGRVILHVDMNSFFASVEIAQDPSLAGKPLAIAGNEKERRGIIITCTYEARKLGIYTTMQLWEAKRLCPNLEVRPPNFPLYKSASNEIFDYFRMITPLVQKVSIDEGYLDITGCSALGTPLEIAKQIQIDLLNSLKLPCSVGIAPNKFLAKMASDMKKPLGITILRKRDVEKILWPLEVGEMHGVGKATSRKLNELGIFTIKELAHFDELILKEHLGIHGPLLKNKANGIDDRIVDPDREAINKSIGSSSTFSADITEETIIFERLEKLSESVSRKLIEQNYVSQNIQLNIKYQDRILVSRSRKLSNPIIESKDIFSAATHLFRKNWNGDAVRLVGVTASDLVIRSESVKQLDLFTYINEKE